MSAVRWPESERTPFEVLAAMLEELSRLPARMTALERQLTDGTIPEKRLLTVAEAAALVGLSERTMYSLIKRGVVPTRDLDSDTRATQIALGTAVAGPCSGVVAPLLHRFAGGLA